MLEIVIGVDGEVPEFILIDGEWYHVSEDGEILDRVTVH